MSAHIMFNSYIDDPKGLELDVVDRSSDNDSLKCVYCKMFLKDPIQNENGDRCCYLCYKNEKRKEGAEIDEKKCFFDKFALKSLNKLLVFCFNKNNGCDWQGSYLDLVEDHIKTCDYTTVQCKLCLEYYPKVDKFHKECLFEECPFCGDTVRKVNMEKHFTVCLRAPPPCKFCGERVVDQMKHMSTCREADCLFQFFGCDGHQGETSEETQAKHNRLIFGMVQGLCAEKVKLEQTLETCQSQAKSLHEEVTELKKENDTLLETNTKLLQVYEECKGGVNQLQSKMVEIDGEMGKLSEEISRRVKGAPSSVIFKEKIASIDRTYSRLNQTLSDLDLRLQLLDNKYVEGKITWKIDNVDFRIAQAKSGEVTALHSAPCYTSQHGYKFCIRVYLDGDGVGKGSHVSLFFVLMKSEYDDILEWPFKRTIKFELLNVEDPNKNVIETFQTDVSSSSFKKPDREMNIAAGCPLFIPNEKFKKGRFVHRNCLYVRATVIEHHDMRFSTY